MFELYSNVRIYITYGVQEFEWHAVDDVGFNDAEAEILEIVQKSGTPVLDGIEPV